MHSPPFGLGFLRRIEEHCSTFPTISTLYCPADVGRNVMLTNGCIIGAFCQVNTCEVIPENTVIYGSGCMRRVQMERPQVAPGSAPSLRQSFPSTWPSPVSLSFSFFQPQTLQLDFLMKILPNYHHLKKTVKAGHHPC